MTFVKSLIAIFYLLKMVKLAVARSKSEQLQSDVSDTGYKIAHSGPLRALHIDGEEIAHLDHHSCRSCCYASLRDQVGTSSSPGREPGIEISLWGPTEELLIWNRHFSSGLRLRTTKRPQSTRALVI